MGYMSGYYEWKMNLNMLEPLSELDTGFEPQTRARSNTWPLPRPENFVEGNGEEKCGQQPMEAASTVTNVANLPMPTIPGKKNSSRRNAWGNLSYADLITQAISSAPEKRLTLSQIYEWMVQNVPYFKDKGDSNSSAGWKVSSIVVFMNELFVYICRVVLQFDSAHYFHFSDTISTKFTKISKIISNVEFFAQLFIRKKNAYEIVSV